jgi:hypothetical protein
MAYRTVKPLLPKKVSDKISIHGDDIQSLEELNLHLNQHTLERLSRRDFRALGVAVQEGRVAVRARGAFELTAEVPKGGALEWNFDVEGDRWRDQCIVCSQLWPVSGSTDLLFSVAPAGTASGSDESASAGLRGRAPAAEDVGDKDWSIPRRIAGRSRGRLDFVGERAGTSCTFVLRWTNDNTIATAKNLQYYVHVLSPARSSPSERAIGEALTQKKGATACRFAFAIILSALSIVLTLHALQTFEGAIGV